jgi:hypothetical protein
LEEGIVEPDLDLGEIEGVIAQFDFLTAEIVGDAVAVSIEGKGGGFGDLAGVTMEKGLAEGFGVGGADGGRLVLAEALEGRLAGLGVALCVINDLNPGQEGLVKKVSDNSISPAPTAVNDIITNNAYAACKADQSHSLLYHPF